MSKRKPHKRSPYLLYIIGVMLLLITYFSYHYRHGIRYYWKVMEKKWSNEVVEETKITKFDIRNIEVMDRYYLKTFGLDVSHYQSEIDWQNTHTMYSIYPIDFVFIRATMGGASQDKTFKANWSGAKENNLIRGAYHFYRPDESSTTQAENFIATVRLEKGDLPPVLDIENMPRNQSMERLIEGLKNWCTLIETHYGIQPIIYTSDRYYEDFLIEHFASHVLWIANYNFFVQEMKAHWHFWQFSEKAQIPGIKGPVDVNIFNGTKDDLKSFLVK